VNARAHHNNSFFTRPSESPVSDGAAPSPFRLVSSPPPKAFEHQRATTDFILGTKRVLCFSDAGTGKTRAVLDAVKQRVKESGKRILVFAPKTILEPAWGEDILQFTRELTYCVATAKNRRSALESESQVVLTNHDAATWIARNLDILEGFDTLVIDESTAFKNFGSQRSKAMVKIAKFFEYRIAMTGTPTPNSVTDVWHQAFIIDDGERLGKSFHKFRSVCCVNKGQGSPFPDWQDKEGILETVADALADITIRYKLEDCTDLPPTVSNTIHFELDRKCRDAYDSLVRHSLINVDVSTISADRAAVLTGKLLQIASGNVYDEDKKIVNLSDKRTELIVDLIEQREHCLVAFLWQHQKLALIKQLEKKKISYRVLDGTIKDKDRTSYVSEFQDGDVKVMLCHPKTAGHGLTLTRATTTIWATPTYNAEWLDQFNRRAYRTGQKKKTEVLSVLAKDTIDMEAMAKVSGKQISMHQLLENVKENYTLMN